jgi:hypothetical protein
MQHIEGYSPLYCKVDKKNKIITITYNENIMDDYGILNHLINICKTIVPVVEESFKN